MKKSIIFILIVVVLIIVIALWRGGSAPTVNQDGTLQGDYSVRDIVKVEQSLQCDLRSFDETSSIIGSVVVAEGKARGDFDIASQQLEAPFASHFILDGDTVYTWTSLAAIGYKAAANDNSPQGGVVSVSDKAAYTCRPWNADLTRFQLPSGITFQELE
jgi:hypothetical protein